MRIVALLAEGVDRNTLQEAFTDTEGKVALLAEGVDRNVTAFDPVMQNQGRPPRGGRG